MLVFLDKATGTVAGEGLTAYRPTQLINNVYDITYPVPTPEGQLRVIVPTEMGAEGFDRLFLLDEAGAFVRCVDPAPSP